MVASFLRNHPDFEIVEAPRYPGFDRGRPEWVEASQSLERAVRLWPHRAPSEGHFIALMQRVKGEAALPERARPGEAPHVVGELLVDFCHNYLTVQIEGQLTLIGHSPLSPSARAARPERPADGAPWLVAGEGAPGLFRAQPRPGHGPEPGGGSPGARSSRSFGGWSRSVCLPTGSPLRSPGEDGWLLVTVGWPSPGLG